MTANVRAWQETDISKIAQVERVCFSDPWSETDLLGCLSLPIYKTYLIEEDGEIIAYACQSVIFEDSEVLNIAVAPKHRGRGYGRKLMQEMLNMAVALKACNVFLEVRVSNETAKSLYRSFGFEEYGLRKNYYPDGENALLMKKTF